jgi:ankyrin repeat protein
MVTHQPIHPLRRFRKAAALATAARALVSQDILVVLELCLLQGAAGVDDEDGTGLTPLHTAAELGAASLAELLLEKGADLNHAGEL